MVAAWARGTFQTVAEHRPGSVPVDTVAGFAPEIACGDHLLEERRRPVFRVAEFVMDRLHHRQEHIEADKIGKRERRRG